MNVRKYKTKIIIGTSLNVFFTTMGIGKAMKSVLSHMESEIGIYSKDLLVLISK